MQAFKNFFIKELVFTFSVGISAVVLFNTVLSSYYLSVFWIILGIIAILTGIMYYSILRINEKSTAKFTSHFMMFSGIKMILYLVFITSYVFLNQLSAKFFLISFFILYFLYTTFEVFQIVKYLKTNKNHK